MSCGEGGFLVDPKLKAQTLSKKQRSVKLFLTFLENDHSIDLGIDNTFRWNLLQRLMSKVKSLESKYLI